MYSDLLVSQYRILILPSDHIISNLEWYPKHIILNGVRAQDCYVSSTLEKTKTEHQHRYIYLACAHAEQATINRNDINRASSTCCDHYLRGSRRASTRSL
jgi:hypothetical protein